MKQHQTSVITSLKKAKSSLDKVLTMIEENKYCIEVVQQNLAVIGLLKSVNLQLLADHLERYFSKAFKTNDKKRQDEIIDELLTIIKTAQNK